MTALSTPSAPGVDARDGKINRQSCGIDLNANWIGKDNMNYYVGILDGAGDVWGVGIPDILGCVGGGPNPEAAIADAVTALREVVAHKRSGGFAVPCPSTLADILASGEVEPGESTIMLPLMLDAGRTVRANLTLDAGLLEAIDAAAAQRGMTRSGFLASAARDKIFGAG